jgi:hypothetical protein
MAKVLVTLEDGLLRRIDRMAESRGMTRSAYLARLAEQDAVRSVGPGASRVSQGAMQRLDRLFQSSPAGDSTAIVRAERNAR